MKLKNIPAVVWLVAFSHFVIELSENFLPIIYPVLIPMLNLSYTQVGFLALVSSTGATFFQPIFGYLTDRFGANRIMVLSVLWTGLIMGLVGLSPNYWLLIILVGGGTLGSSAFHPSGVAMMSTGVAAHRRGSTFSIFSVMGSLGTALSPLLIAYMVRAVDLPGTLILTPLAIVIGFFLFRQMWNRSGGVATAVSAGAGGASTVAQGGSKLALTLVVLMVMCRSWLQGSVNTYLPEWLQTQGYSLESAGQVFSAMLVATSVGTLIGGTLSDRVGRWQVVGGSLLLLNPAVWLLLHSAGAVQVGAAMLTGALLGSSFPVTVAMAGETWPKGVGLAASLVMGLGWFPGGIGASVTGAIADHSTLTSALQWLMVAPLVGLVFVALFALHQKANRPAVSSE